jgi:hypothetical protein
MNYPYDPSIGRRESELPKIRQVRQQQAPLISSALPIGFRLTFRMKALVALAHRPAGLTLRENIFDLGFSARKITIGWFP